MQNNYFKSNLKYLRLKGGIEQQELASMLGYKSASAVSEWEKGKRIPRAGTLSDISNIFNVNLTDLMNKDLASINMKKNTSNIRAIPLLGTIAAGTPIFAEENIEEYFNIDSSIKADFALRIKGDSMIDAGIYTNDIVFIKQQCNLENGTIGAVLIDDSATLKRFYKDNGSIVLQAENSAYKPIILTEGNVRVLGKLVAVLNIRDN